MKIMSIPWVKFIYLVTFNNNNRETNHHYISSWFCLFLFQTPSSTTDSVLIDRVSLAAEGLFKCEVSVTPTYETKSGSSMLRVGRRPQIKIPFVQMMDETGNVIVGRSRRYENGETLNLNCTSIGGYPTPNITWFINGEKVKT